MRWLAVMLLAGGCDRVFGFDHVPTATADAPAVIDAARFSCSSPVLADEFTETTPCAPWGTLAAAGNATATEGSGRLTFDLPNMGEARCSTNRAVAFPGGGLAVQVAQVPAGTSSYASLESSALDVELYLFAGRLGIARAGGSPVIASVQYNGAEMQFWRITPDAQSMTAVGSYSADGITWTDMAPAAPLASIPATIDVQLKAGAIGTGQPATAEFRHLVACP
ncbi:MAG: hypothetical protein JO257_07305 [Deltaproteobacteria bacterium]|nr:hypothetical protein [Bradyrhizobium sp.]MBV8757062.1 hypothetical protein [Deltaproteobacteria bacterium]